MNKIKPTLVILAAGIGSRYGGLKQLDTFSSEGDTIMDFSIYDALQAGFGKFVFIIRKHIEEEFKEVFNKKLAGKAEVDYVFQELEYVPAKYQNPERQKPWGTGHAMMMAKDVVKENFAIINADDFYGKEAFEIMAKELTETDKESYDFSTMAYLLKNTVSDHGFVSRGECKVNNDGYLTDVTERTYIEKINGHLICKHENGAFVPIDENTIRAGGGVLGRGHAVGNDDQAAHGAATPATGNRRQRDVVNPLIGRPSMSGSAARRS